MAHCGSLNTQLVSDDIHDVRGATVRGSDGEKLGNVDDLIFDHDTMIHYLVVDSGGWLEARTSCSPRKASLSTKPTTMVLLRALTDSRSKILRHTIRNRWSQKMNGRNTNSSTSNIGKRNQ